MGMALYLPQEVATGAYFRGRDVFLAIKYFSECIYLCMAMDRRCTITLFIDSLVFMVVGKIKKHLLGLTQANILTLALLTLTHPHF